MRGRVPVRGIVAAADMAARAADPQMEPSAAALQAFLAAERARRDVLDAGDMAAPFGRHWGHTSCVSKNIMSTPPLANFGKSAAVALPSGLPKAAWTAAILSKVRIAIR